MRITWTEGERFVPEKLLVAAAKRMVVATGEHPNFLSFLSQHQQLDKERDREKRLWKINHCHLIANRMCVEKGKITVVPVETKQK